MENTPWRVKQITYPAEMDVNFEVVGANDDTICQTFMREIGEEDRLIERDRDHMHLFSAAPELLESLKEAYEAIQIVQPGISGQIYKKSPEMKRWMAAINKAEGRQP